MKNQLQMLAAASASALFMAACESTGAGNQAVEKEAASETAMEDGGSDLQAIIDARSDKDKARDQYRNPAETLAFFGVEPDMTVVETLPGGGWYSRILIPYLDADGAYAAASYQYEMFPKILPNPTEEVLARIKGWADGFPAQAAGWGATGDVAAFEFGNAPEEMKGTVDAVLMIRALHNFNRAGGDYGAEALAETYALLKPGGVVGVVQHRANEDAEGANADGTYGYMSEEAVIAMLTGAGFEFEEKSEINANPADNPGDGDIVWRLPPTLALGDKDRDAYIAIGETDRMTMRFRKPAE